MPADNELDPLDRWLNQQVRPLPPPSGTFELITRRARRRRIRKAVISVAGAAAVAAAVGVAVPVGMSLHLTTHVHERGAGRRPAGTRPSATQTTLGKASKVPSASATSRAASSASSPGRLRDGDRGPEQSRLAPVQFLSLLGDLGLAVHRLGPGARGDAGAVRRAAGLGRLHVDRDHPRRRRRPGRACPRRRQRASAACGSSTQSTAGRSARSCGRRTTAASTGTRWTPATCPSPQLETINGRAYALFADCRNIDGNPDAACTSYTLKTATAGSDDWTPVGGVPGDLTGGTLTSRRPPASRRRDTRTRRRDGHAARDRLPGRARRHAVRRPPRRDCLAQGSGAAVRSRTGDRQRRAAAGAAVDAGRHVARRRIAAGDGLHQTAAGTTSVYLSNDDGADLDRAGRRRVLNAAPRRTESLTALPDGTLILAAVPRAAASGKAAASTCSPRARRSGRRPACRTRPLEDLRLHVRGHDQRHAGGSPQRRPDLHAIWMTTDGGQTWTSARSRVSGPSVLAARRSYRRSRPPTGAANGAG